MKERLAVGVSGSGTTLEAIIESGITVDFVFADRKCRGLEVATAHRIDTLYMRRAFQKGTFGKEERQAYSNELCNRLQSRGIDVVALAGYRTGLTGSIIGIYAGRMLNTHPSLLPLFPGDHAIRDALKAGANETGCTVHFVVEEIDAGPIIDRARVPIYEGDTEDTVRGRIQAEERPLYCLIIREIMAG